MKLTPVLYVDAIEPSLPFWSALGFATAFSVPEGDRLGFVSLVRGEVEVMLQTRANLAHDLPAFASLERGPSVLYLEVDALDVPPGAAVLVPERVASYGPREIWLREPGGHVVGLALRT
jgi:hypothetical protein